MEERHDFCKNVHKLEQLGNDFSNTIKKRAKVKFITYSYLSPLIALNSPLKRSYFYSKNCVQLIILNPNTNKLTSKYCGHRWCLVCNRIRTGKLINAYQTEFNNLKDPYLVTLTPPNCSKDELKSTIENMQKIFVRINNNLRKSKRISKGIRKTEVTYNPARDDFHPHFHIIIENESSAKFLIDQWLKSMPGAHIKGQHMRKADPESMKELFKYVAKLGAKSKIDNKTLFKLKMTSLDSIFQALYKKRIFQAFGGLKQVNDDIDDVMNIDMSDQFQNPNFTWYQEFSNWFNEDGENLCDNEYYKTIEVHTE